MRESLKKKGNKPRSITKGIFVDVVEGINDSLLVLAWGICYDRSKANLRRYWHNRGDSDIVVV